MSTVNTVIIPAAGMGNRLGDLTKNKPKCLVEVNGIPLLTRLLESLCLTGFEKIVLITGYKSELIEEYISNYNGSLKIETVHNPKFETTNNIYSVWLALSLLENTEAFTLIESDLIFDYSILSHFRQPDVIALDIYNPCIHSGTIATVNPNGYLNALYVKSSPTDVPSIYKTVNITSFSDVSAMHFKRIMSEKIQQKMVSDYYEIVIQEMIQQRLSQFKMADFTGVAWGEIDTKDDLERVSNQFELENLYI